MNDNKDDDRIIIVIIGMCSVLVFIAYLISESPKW